MKLRTEINWWVPGGSVTYVGSPKSRLEWIKLTWRGYLAWWRLAFRVAWLMVVKKDGN